MKLKPHVSLAGSSTNSSVFVHQRANNCPSMTKINRGQDTHYLSVCTKFVEVDQNVQIGMKLELDVWHHPLNVYAKFQTDISKHVQKKSRKLFAGWEL